jgi:hypothetical protein
MVTQAFPASPLMALVALPLVALHRSFRRTQPVDASRIRGKTGLLNAAWQREARLETTRAIRTVAADHALYDVRPQRACCAAQYLTQPARGADRAHRSRRARRIQALQAEIYAARPLPHTQGGCLIILNLNAQSASQAISQGQGIPALDN